MKKILGISLVAVLAATPLMAGAATIASNVDVEGDAFTTQSYVKGAYNAALGEIRKVNNDLSSKQDAITAGNSPISTSVVQVNDVHTIANIDNAADDALISEKAVLSAINTAVSGLSSDVDTLENQMGEATLTNALSSTTVTEAINELSSEKVDNAGNFAGDNEPALIQGKTVVNAIKDIATATTSVASTVANYSTDLAAKQNKSDSEVSAQQATAHSDLLNQGVGVAGNLVKLATGIETVDGTAIPVATGWANGTNGADTTTSVTISSLRS